MARRPKPAPKVTDDAQLIPPPNGAIVRMYRIGHGDCFLIAFAGKKEDKPAYILIDCGYKPGSPGKLATPTAAKDIGAHIIKTTGGFVDIAVVTHEHQDHVNGFTAANFPELKVGQVWFAWTEDPDDEIANRLRKKFKDRLLGLIDASNQLSRFGLDQEANTVKFFLELELGEEAAPFGVAGMGAAGKDPASSSNKLAMRFLRDSSTSDSAYLLPHGKPIAIERAASARAFVLGPPRDMDKIDDLNPEGDETFGDDDHAQAVAPGSSGIDAARSSSFPRRHIIALDALLEHPQVGEFFQTHYGDHKAPVPEAPDGDNIRDNATWRQIGRDSTQDAEILALAMNNATNNSSLVLAFELSKGGKVLLFAGDAQAGNWRSWSDDKFKDNGMDVTAKDLLSRTVLYKVGHHGSHNATLNGKPESEHANLSWMAQAANGDEFVAMITAVENWAHQKPKPDWNHPFPAIKDALQQKTRGRVLQTDSDLQDHPPANAKASDWRAFRKRVKQTSLYFDLVVEG